MFKNNKKDTQNILLTYPYIFIGAICFILYGLSLSFDFVNLDDQLFIIDQYDLISKPENFITYFKRGIFSEKNDQYYRPMFLVSLMMNAQVGQQNPFIYHLSNILYHIIAVSLLFLILTELRIKKENAFLLSIFFTVHPVVSSAVVWIPGCNDLLLAIFSFASFLCFLKYLNKGGILFLVLHCCLFFMALVTKEPSIVLPIVITIFILLFYRKKNVLLFLTPGWFICISFWYYLRSSVVEPLQNRAISDVISLFLYRLPVLLQYIGKIILPFNNSVFPIMEDTTIWLGVLSLFIIITLLILSPQRNIRMIIFGTLWFLCFILPSFLVPKGYNNQTFEHRLYIPLLGILLIINEISLVKLKERISPIVLKYFPIVVIVIFAGITFIHTLKYQGYFSFWEAAVRESPHASTAHSILGMNYFLANRKEEAKNELEQALSINNQEKFDNYYLGKYYMEKGDTNKAEKYFIQEPEHITDLNDKLLTLAQLYYKKGDKDKEIECLRKVESIEPGNIEVHKNLLNYYTKNERYDRALFETAMLKKYNTPNCKRYIEKLDRDIAKYFDLHSTINDSVYNKRLVAIAISYYHYRQDTIAEKYLLKAEAISPANTMVRLYLLLIYKHTKQYAKARYEAAEMKKYGNLMGENILKQLPAKTTK